MYVTIIAIKLQYEKIYDEEIVSHYILISFFGFVITVNHLYFIEKKDRNLFKNQQTVEKLLKEQKDIFENLPDGLIIHNKKYESYSNNLP